MYQSPFHGYDHLLQNPYQQPHDLHIHSPPQPIPSHQYYNSLLQSPDSYQGYDTSSMYSSSFPSSSSFLQRSVSSLSIHPPALDHRPELSDSPGPMRRVFSTGDIDPFGVDASATEGAGSGGGAAVPANSSPSASVITGKVGRYSAEERKERIERYRSKRNQRNFQKKITYACRKTLADSRPRVRGRFARNGEVEADGEDSALYDGACGGPGWNCCEWGEGETSAASNSTALTAERSLDDEEYYDHELWASLFQDFSMNSMVPQ